VVAAPYYYSLSNRGRQPAGGGWGDPSVASFFVFGVGKKTCGAGVSHVATRCHTKTYDYLGIFPKKGKGWGCILSIIVYNGGHTEHKGRNK
tara:strand:+ start:311 stop:583 length:273 start_codon:yes stop_codon:yes gene_type:complete